MTIPNRVRTVWRSAGRVVKRDLGSGAFVVRSAGRGAGVSRGESAAVRRPGAKRQPAAPPAAEPYPQPLTGPAASLFFDGIARRVAGMSGDDFRRRYDAGELDREDASVIRVAMLLPFAR